MSKAFSKPALAWNDQLELLRARGLHIADPEMARFYLERLNYYRLASYWQPLLQSEEPPRFRDGACFDDVHKLYVLDRELRVLILDAIERIEVAARTQWAHHLAVEAGPHAHLDPSLAKDRGDHLRLLRSLMSEVQRTSEPAIEEHLETYAELLPPTWVTCEAMSFGQLSQWIRNLASSRVRKRIARTFDTPPPLFESWLGHLVHVRNRAAHQGRMWNHAYTRTPMRPRQHPRSLVNAWRSDDRHIYNTLLILLHFMEQVSPQSTWPGRVLDLLHRFGEDWWHHMGIPPSWQAQHLWTVAAARS